MEEAFLHLGGCIGYWGGDVRKIAEDIKACQPTIFCSVPRVYERFHNVVMEKVGVRGGGRRGSAAETGSGGCQIVPRLDNLAGQGSVL
jgi:long-subunit acyl-CoA synthetase (AMP-forming)